MNNERTTAPGMNHTIKKEKTISVWQNYNSYWEIQGKECSISLEPRNSYCDRGNYIAKITKAWGELQFDLDGQDGWPRYFFDEARAKLEVEAWLRKRGQWIE